MGMFKFEYNLGVFFIFLSIFLVSVALYWVFSSKIIVADEGRDVDSIESLNSNNFGE